MTKPNLIKTDLFRFVTFRNVDTAKLLDKEIRFVIDKNFYDSIPEEILTPITSEKTATNFTTNLSSLSKTKSVVELKKFNENIFKIANSSFRANNSVTKISGVTGTLSESEITQLFQELYAEFLNNNNSLKKEMISKMLIVDHAIKNADALQEMGIDKLTDIKIEIPQPIVEQIKQLKYGNCSSILKGVVTLGVADFRKIEQEVSCYVPGEVSHIENVMSKEYKERTTRNYVRTENTIETSRETEIENLTDITTATRNEINTEVANVLNQERNNNYGGSLAVTTEWLGADIVVNAYADFSNASSSTYSNSEAKTYAQEVTKRALERIVQKTSEKRTSKIIKEFEENNKHGFDNRGDNATNITGVYRWLDIIYKNRLINYGKRLMVEFMVPEPAEFYKRILKYVPKEGNVNPNQDFPKPKSLEDFAINGPENITRDNYITLANYYGITLDEPLIENRITTKTILPPMPPNSDNNSKTYAETIMIEQFYETNEVVSKVDVNYTWSSGHSAYFKMDVGDISFNIILPRGGRKKDVSKNFNAFFTTKYTNSVEVNFDYRKLNTCSAYIELRCKLTSEKFSEWQTSAYQKLLTAYKSMLADYNNWLEEQNSQNNDTDIEAKHTNPAMFRIIEQRELKRACIEMITKPFCREQGRNNLQDEVVCEHYKIPKIMQTEEFSKYIEQIKFFEQAIDWQLMSYFFYPYYWAKNCKWGDLLQSESEDLVFQAFLQSSMSRVVVPIRLQFASAFSYYMETGEIDLTNSFVAGSINDTHLSITEELQNADTETILEQEWETRVPTSLAIIQGKSAYLNQEGLPCCTAVENSETTSTVQVSTDVLQLINP